MRFAIVLVLLLTACGSSPVSLESLLIKDGDLPPLFTPGQVRDFPQGDLERIPKADDMISQGIASDGRIAILRYKDKATLSDAFTMLDGWFPHDIGPDSPLNDVGERRIAEVDSIEGFRVVFVRCNALAYIRLPILSEDIDLVMTAYAKRLDQRITDVLC